MVDGLLRVLCTLIVLIVVGSLITAHGSRLLGLLMRAGKLRHRVTIQYLADSAQYLRLDGVVGNYASTPDSAAASITGDIDIRVKVALDDWTPALTNSLISKRAGAGNRSYRLVSTTNGLSLVWSADGTIENTSSSTVPTGITDGASKWVRATLDADNGASGNDVKFYTSDDYDPLTQNGTWTQLGATVTTANTSSIFDSATSVEVGSNTGGTIQLAAGEFYRAQIFNGIDGTLAVDFDPSLAAAGDLSFTADTGEVWTVTQTGSPQGAELIVGSGQQDTGEPDVVWADLATVYAEWRTLRGNELFASQEHHPEVRGIWAMRWREDLDLTAKMRIVHDGLTYNILYVPPYGRSGKRDVMEIDCSEGMNAG